MKTAELCKDVSGRDQYNKLSHNGDNHTEHCFSERLEYGTDHDTEPCDQVMDTDNAECRNADCEHIFGCIEHAEQYLWNSLEGEESDEGQAESNDQAEFNRFDHSFSLFGSVVVSDDRCDTIVQTENRHEEEAL